MLLENTDDHGLSDDEMAYLAGALFGAGTDTVWRDLLRHVRPIRLTYSIPDLLGYHCDDHGCSLPS